MNGAPRWLVVGPALFSIFVSDTGSVIECAFSKFASDPKLCGVVDTLERSDAIQRDLHKLERWAHANAMKFSAGPAGRWRPEGRPGGEPGPREEVGQGQAGLG